MTKTPPRECPRCKDWKREGLSDECPDHEPQKSAEAMDKAALECIANGFHGIEPNTHVYFAFKRGWEAATARAEGEIQKYKSLFGKECTWREQKVFECENLRQHVAELKAKLEGRSLADIMKDLDGLCAVNREEPSPGDWDRVMRCNRDLVKKLKTESLVASDQGKKEHMNHSRCGTVKKVTIECCVNCDWPKIPSAEHEWKCQNKFCASFDSPTSNVSYHRAHIPLSELEVSDAKPAKPISELSADELLGNALVRELVKSVDTYTGLCSLDDAEPAAEFLSQLVESTKPFNKKGS